jgi:hypothetical protein
MINFKQPFVRRRAAPPGAVEPVELTDAVADLSPPARGRGKGRKARAPRRALPLLTIAMVTMTALGAAAVALYAYRAQQAVELLSGINATRAAVRTLYNSKQGYGRPEGAPVTGHVGKMALPPHWEAIGESVQHNLGGTMTVSSQVTTFTVSLGDIAPAVCQRLLPALDEGWREVRYEGQAVLMPVGPADARSLCGFLRPGQLELVSAG